MTDSRRPGTEQAEEGAVHTSRHRWLTTAATHDPESAPGRRWLPPALAGAYAALWAGTAVAPVDRVGWLLESALPLSLVALLAGMYRRWHLSDASYLCIGAFLALHTIGAHHTYPGVPLGEWLRDAFAVVGWGTRNPYDRLVHLAFGLLAVYPLRELLQHHVWRQRTAAVLAVGGVLALSAVYEVLEWAAARVVAPAAAARFVGAQGDPWDAQQDMALAWLGSVLGALASSAGARGRGGGALRPPRAGGG
jgi:putative membrane protein